MSKEDDSKKNLQILDVSTQKIEINTSNLLVKSNMLIEARFNYSVYQHRLFNHLVSKIGKNDDEFYEYSISFAEIAKECNMAKADVYKNNGALVREMSISMIERSLQMYVGK